MSIRKTSKAKRKRSPWFVILILIILVAGSTIYASRDSIKRVYYGYKSRAALGSQIKTLSSSLATLGISNAKVASKCSEESVFGYSIPQLQCVSERQNYIVIGANAASKTNFTSKAQELDSLLKSDGWVTTSNSATTLGQWFQGITTGKDYSTDIDSVRNNGNTHCSLVFKVAYSNPQPPAFEIRMSCSVPVLEKVKDYATF